MSRWATLVLASCALAGCGLGSGPPRPPGIPATARWAGNIEGGTWLDCQPLPPESLRYTCRAWFETGALIAEGPYLLRRRTWNQAQLRSEYTEPASAALPAFDGFDGRWITLKGDLVLLPDGVVSYPAGAGHGRRQEYRLGEAAGSAMDY
jgi:hypothetical protein